MTSSDQRWPGECDVAFPAPFNNPPAPVTVEKPGQLPYSQIQKYFTEGYIVVKDYFKPSDLDPCREDIKVMVDKLAHQLYDAGKVKSLYSELGLFQRLTKLEEDFTGANVLLFKYQKMPQSFQKLWSSPRLLNLMEQILGPEVAGHPTWNLRTKTPRSEAVNIPWHQDAGYMSNDSYDHMIACAWIPFLDATEENGCMQFARSGHKTGKVAKHECCAGPTWYIMLKEEDMQDTLGVDLDSDVITEPIPYGSFILFNNLIPHRSLPNVSNDIRWSVDLRWQSPRHSYGFYDIQDGILFRSPSQPDLQPDWPKFFSVDRKEVWAKKYAKSVEASTGQFDTRITGPWIQKWEIVHHNPHTQLFTSITSR